jgi:hypothetical protein
MRASPRWLRTLWPELVFGALWVVLLTLMHTVVTDDDVWPHTLLDALQWVVFAGYVIAVFGGGRRRRPALHAAD